MWLLIGFFLHAGIATSYMPHRSLDDEDKYEEEVEAGEKGMPPVEDASNTKEPQEPPAGSSKDPLPPITTPRVTTESDQSTVARLESLLAAHKTLQEQVNHLMAREGRTQGLLGGQSKGRRQQSGKTLLKSWMGANKVAVEPTVEPPVESGK